MAIDRISIRPAENGFIVNVSKREEYKRGRGSDYSEKDKIAVDEKGVLKIVCDALGKTEKKKGRRGVRVLGGEVAEAAPSQKKKGKKKRTAYKR